MERTLTIIKPDAFDKSEEIEEIIKNEGFQILQSKTFTMTKEQASEFYAEHTGKPFFSDLITYMTSGPIKALVLTRENAIDKWRQLIGPTNVVEAKAEQPDSIRAKFGTSEYRNAVHGSSNFPIAEWEIGLFFPDVVSQPTVTGQEAKAYLAETVNPILLKGLTELCKQKPSDPIQVDQCFENEKPPNWKFHKQVCTVLKAFEIQKQNILRKISNQSVF